MTIMPWTGPGPNPEQPWGLMGPRRRQGLFGASVQQPAMTAVEHPQKPGFDWRKLVGVLGDSLAIAGGGQAQYVPNLIDQRQRQQAQAYAEQQYQRRRQDEWADWQRQEQWKRDNPAPVNNDTINDFNWYKSLSPDDQRVYDAMHPIVVDVTDESGRVTKQLVPRSQLIGGGGNRPAIGAVVADPRKAGGQPVAPAGNFPR